MIVMTVDLGGVARGIFTALLASPERRSILGLLRHFDRLPTKEASNFLGTTFLFYRTRRTPVQG